MTVKKRKNKTNYGLRVQGTIRVFAKEKTVEFNGVDTKMTDTWFNVSNKVGESDYENKSMKILFNRETGVPENNSVIEVFEGWFMLYGKEKYQQVVLYVKDWEYSE